MKEDAMNRFNTIAFRFTAAALFGATLSTTAVANIEYKCDQPHTPLDQRACDAATQGPVALRRFIERVRMIESLDFYNYMADAQILAWRANERTRTASVNVARNGEAKR
jgi:hypothetical protein